MKRSPVPDRGGYWGAANAKLYPVLDGAGIAVDNTNLYPMSDRVDIDGLPDKGLYPGGQIPICARY